MKFLLAKMLVGEILFAFILIIVFCNNAFSKESKHYIFAQTCVRDFPNHLSNYDSCIIFSYCSLRNKDNPFPEQKRLPFISISHFSPHSFIVTFENISWEAWHFRRLYMLIFIQSSHMELLEYIPTKYREFTQYGHAEAITELLHTRWNLDHFIVINSWQALESLIFSEGQLPTSLQKQEERFKANNISDLDVRYHITSGYRQQCIHSDWYEKLASLTYNFNAYDRIFCDVLEYHGLQRLFEGKGYWNHYDMFHLRGRLIRDGLISSFPPDASTAVYFACPKLTFVVLRGNRPTTWLFAVRPFQISLWTFLLVTFTSLEIMHHLKKLIEYYHSVQFKRRLIKRKLFAIIIHPNDQTRLHEIGNRYKNILEILSGILRIMLASAYSGMILVGILHPLYPFTPDTFEELNNTQNYFVGTALESPAFIMDHLRERYIINKVAKHMIKSRTKLTPAEFLEYSISKEFTEEKENEDKFYAAVMYDDKMNLWMKGRFFIWRTAPFLGRIKPATQTDKSKNQTDKVLPEIRYFSVAPGATRLHFLMVTLKRVFTSGTALRWHYLEQNYYKNVAPILAVKKLQEAGKEQPKDEHERRPLTIQDVFSVFVIKGLALVFAFLVCMLELYTTCEFSQVL